MQCSASHSIGVRHGASQDCQQHGTKGAGNSCASTKINSARWLVQYAVHYADVCFCVSRERKRIKESERREGGVEWLVGWLVGVKPLVLLTCNSEQSRGERRWTRSIESHSPRFIINMTVTSPLESRSRSFSWVQRSSGCDGTKSLSLWLSSRGQIKKIKKKLLKDRRWRARRRKSYHPFVSRWVTNFVQKEFVCRCVSVPNFCWFRLRPRNSLEGAIFFILPSRGMDKRLLLYSKTNLE